MQRHQAVRRAHEMHAGPAVGQLVAHDLRDRQLSQRIVQRLLQPFGQRGARNAAVEEQRLGLALALALELRHRHIGRADSGQLLQQRLGRLAVGIERHRHRHQLLQQLPVVRFRRHAGHVHSQAAR
jgi:hypothetical protein